MFLLQIFKSKPVQIDGFSFVPKTNEQEELVNESSTFVEVAPPSIIFSMQQACQEEKR